MSDVSSLGSRSPLFTPEANDPPATTAKQVEQHRYGREGRYGLSVSSANAPAQRDALVGAWAIYLGHLRGAPDAQLKQIAVAASIKAPAHDPALPSQFLAPALESKRAALDVVRRADMALRNLPG